MKIPLVLVSGLLSNDYLWHYQVKHLSEIASIHIVSPDQNTPEKMVQAVLDVAPPVFALAGHSMGGWLCLEIMRKAPFRVSKLCLLNTTARNDSNEKRKRRKKMISMAKDGYFQEIIEEIVNHFVFNPLFKSNVKKMFLEVGKEAFIHQEEAMIQRYEVQSILPRISCPTMVIHAAQDKNFSLEEHEEIAAKISNAKLAVVEDSGHMSPLEMPQAITTLLRLWLAY
jgi:pimeloyl-ACP methyl ester carboxylesterase